MPIAFKCPGCEKSYQVKIELAGKQFKCKACGGRVQVPRPKRRQPSKPVASNDDDDDFMNALCQTLSLIIRIYQYI